MASHKPKSQTKKDIAVETRPRWTALTLGVALAVITLAAHFPPVFAGYTSDDSVSLHSNPLIAAPDGIYRFWFSDQILDYWPLTSTMFWLEWRMWGKDPMPYHIANILLHAIAAVTLWRVLLRINVGALGAFLAGLLFAVHPVTVESVAWISERKNLLSMVLFLLAILAYLRFDGNKQVRWYVTALLVALAALLAKSSVVMLPLVLLICVWWRRSSLTRRDILKMLPFFAISLILGLVTIWFQQHHAIANVVVRPEGLASRVAAVGWVFWFYVYKLVVPINLAMIYPRWDIDGGNVLSYLPLAMLITCFVVLLCYRNRWGRGPLAALAAFTIILAPVLGLVNMSYARFSLVADHLQYPGIPAMLALIGGGLASAWSRAHNMNRVVLARAIAVVIGAAVLTLAGLTWRQAQLFGDNITLWSHTIALNDRAWAAYGNRGNDYIERRDYDRAMQDCNKAIEIKPDYAEALNNRGKLFKEKGNYEQAILDCNKAIEVKFDYAEAYNNRGAAYGGKGDHAQAILDFTKAIEHKPALTEAYANRGTAFTQQKAHHQVIRDFTKVIELSPGSVDAYKKRSIAFFYLKEYDRAWADVNRCKQLGGQIPPSLIANLAKASGRTE